jgi:excinuclease UvrABC nuclease subunit
MHERLTEEMRKAAAAQEYERAAELRDLLEDLKRTTRRCSGSIEFLTACLW